VKVETSSTVQSIDGDRLHFLRTTEDPPTVETLSGIDTFVNAPGARSFDPHSEELRGHVDRLEVIGDACSPKTCLNAIAHGAEVARSLKAAAYAAGPFGFCRFLFPAISSDDRKTLVFRRRCGELFLNKSMLLSRHHANDPGKTFLSFPVSFCRHICVRYVPSSVQNKNTLYFPILINLRPINNKCG